jgi:hypothetical protein
VLISEADAPRILSHLAEADGAHRSAQATVADIPPDPDPE